VLSRYDGGLSQLYKVYSFSSQLNSFVSPTAVVSSDRRLHNYMFFRPFGTELPSISRCWRLLLLGRIGNTTC